MSVGKSIKERGKIRFSEYFKNLSDNEKVSIVIERSIPFPYPRRLQGKTGIVVGSKGSHKIVKIREWNKEKEFIIHPVHLRRLK